MQVKIEESWKNVLHQEFCDILNRISKNEYHLIESDLNHFIIKVDYINSKIDELFSYFLYKEFNHFFKKYLYGQIIQI